MLSFLGAKIKWKFEFTKKNGQEHLQKNSLRKEKVIP